MRRVRAAASFPRSAASTPFYSAARSLLLTTRHLAERLLTELTLFGRHFIRIWTYFYFYFYIFWGLFSFLSTHLHAGLGEIDFQRHLFAHEYVRVASFGKQRLQNVELCARKSSPLSSLLPRRRCG